MSVLPITVIEYLVEWNLSNSNFTFQPEVDASSFVLKTQHGVETWSSWPLYDKKIKVNKTIAKRKTKLKRRKTCIPHYFFNNDKLSNTIKKSKQLYLTQGRLRSENDMPFFIENIGGYQCVAKTEKFRCLSNMACKCQHLKKPE